MSTVAPKTFSDLLACEVGINMTILSFPWPFGRLIADIWALERGPSLADDRSRVSENSIRLHGSCFSE